MYLIRKSKLYTVQYTYRAKRDGTPNEWPPSNEIYVYCIGVFKWESRNQTLDDLYTNWGEGEPNNHDDREDCVEFR